jgi:enterochelin esterase-like enzyme
MTIKTYKRIGSSALALIFFLSIAGCALSTYISHLNTTPTSLLIFTPPVTDLTTLVANSTETPILAQTDSPTGTPTITATPTAVPCTDIAGTIQRVLVPSTVLEGFLPVSIYLPPCYEPEGNYPVLYLLHGQAQTDQFWIDLGVTTIADEAIRGGATPFIMIFPFEEDAFEDNATSKFPDAIIFDVIPWVDANFATCTERICRSIGGVSRGGGWAIKLAMRNIDLFGTLGAHSYGLMFGDASWVEKNLRTHSVEEFPRIYLDRGEKDSLANDIDLFVSVLQANEIRPEFNIYPGNHTVSYWREHVQEYMDFYMAAWPEPFK